MRNFEVTAKTVDRILVRESIHAELQLPYNITSEVFTDVIGETHVRLRTYVYTEKKSSQVSVDVIVPANWWQHLVDSTFPNWYKRRFPVKTKTITETKRVHFDVFYPEFRPAGGLQPYVVVREVAFD